MANLVITYTLWLFGGWLGLHHLYLGRDKHSFIWWATCGGCFGLGWVRDLWRLPEYVRAANKDPGYIRELNAKAKLYPFPVFSAVRFSGELVVGFLFGLLLRLSIPDEYVETLFGRVFTTCLPPLGVAAGVWLVGNVQPEKVSMQWALLGAYITVPMLAMDSGNNIIYSALLSAIFVNWKEKTWNKDFTKRRHFCTRLFILTLCGLIYLSLWTSAIYLNATITTKEGDEVPLRDAVNNFFTSPAWEDTKQQMRNLYQYVQTHGWQNVWNEIVESLDPLGETKAYKVLGVKDTATEEDIKIQYKKLVKKWHPDKQKDPEKKSEAQKKFIEIQQAYETLSTIKTKRTQRNKRSRKDEQPVHTEF